MREIIPFKKDILFKTRINEITNITLEHDYKILDNMIEGDFLLNGTYKMTEASVINEDFFYKVPFSIAISNKIKRESIELNIKDFNYEIVDFDILKINVELLLNCEEEEVKIEEIENLDNEERQIDEILDEILKEEKEEVEVLEIKEETNEKVEEVRSVEELDEERKFDIDSLELSFGKKKKKDKVEEEEINSVVDSVKEKNEYVTYKVYLAKESDSYDSISSRYGVDINELLKYNDNSDINIGDKIIIPYIFNE